MTIDYILQAETLLKPRNLGHLKFLYTQMTYQMVGLSRWDSDGESHWQCASIYKFDKLSELDNSGLEKTDYPVVWDWLHKKGEAGFEYLKIK